jgi:hypothetical protein
MAAGRGQRAALPPVGPRQAHLRAVLLPRRAGPAGHRLHRQKGELAKCNRGPVDGQMCCLRRRCLPTAQLARYGCHIAYVNVSVLPVRPPFARPAAHAGLPCRCLHRGFPCLLPAAMQVKLWTTLGGVPALLASQNLNVGAVFSMGFCRCLPCRPATCCCHSMPACAADACHFVSLRASCAERRTLALELPGTVVDTVALVQPWGSLRPAAQQE